MPTITDKAAERIVEILLEENQPNTKVRVFVEGGGCSGFQYGFTLGDEVTEEDFVIEHAGAELIIDGISMQYLQNANIDFVEDIHGSQFKINNPQAATTCGCGSSFSA